MKLKKILPYNPARIEKKWQSTWNKNGIYSTKDNLDKEKRYVLDMFPYPSGEGLHVGHPKGYIATDIYSRAKKKQGFNVLHPMGWDAFGLPAENYAIQNKVHPEAAVKKNIATFKKQLEKIGFNYDWSREINTTDPAYYKWTQWIFLKLYEKGLAYESYAPIHWCPSCKTGLANEDVEDGKCERCGTLVEKRPMRQWMLKITDYAERLLTDLDATEPAVPLIEVTSGKFAVQPEKKTVERQCILAIVKHWEKDEYLCLRAHLHGWTTFVIGGIEKGEDPLEAARREIVEEPGYKDLTYVKTLGKVIKAQHFAPHKNENRLAELHGFYFELTSGARADVQPSELEHQEVLWIPREDIPNTLDPKITDWAFWNRLLGNEGSLSEPCFVTRAGPDAVCEGMPFVERNAIIAIVKHWSEDSYIGLKWKKADWRTFITGGIKKGQTAEQAAIAEIKEETGYLHPVLKKNLGIEHSKFFHLPKKENRFGHFTILYFELKDAAQKSVAKEEQEHHDVAWVAKEEVSRFITPAAQKYAWSKVNNTSVCRYSETSKPLLEWPESIKESQRNWIGKSEGLLFEAPVKDTDLTIQTFSAHFEAFAADTFVVIAPDHPFLPELVRGTESEKKVLTFANKLLEKRVGNSYNLKDNEGIFTGRYITDPVGNGDLPIWVASYALSDYGTGIVKCSAHDERDFAFAKKYSIPLKEVLEPVFRQTKGEDKIRETLPFIHRDAVVCLVKHWTENKYLCLKWKKTDWTGFVVGGIEKGEDAVVAGIREIKEETGYSNVRFVKKLGGTIHSLFFHPLKKENRLAHFQGLYFELTESKREEISEEEKNIHDVHWISADKVKEFLNVDDMKLFWERCNGIEKPWMNIQDSVLMEPSAFAGKIASEFREEISIYLEKNKLARKKTTYKLRDWVFSRQRYWGEPIPIIHCLACGVVPVPEKNLPVKLPQVSHYEPTGTGESPLAAIEAWVNVKCPRCKGHAKRETNTMPQWAGSSWYFLRFEDPKNKKMLVDSTKEKYWSPVDMYVGGAEHATRHLIYARFWYKFLNDIGVVDYNEPFKRLKHVGLIMAPDGKKMSKRYGNVINPDHIVATWGADTLRLYEMFMGPFSQSVSWSTESIIGSRRFIEKVWRFQRAWGGKGIGTPGN